MSQSPDEWLVTVLRRSPEEGWRLFVDRYTPTMLALIERGGVTDRDEAMDIYARTCERLSERRCERLRRHDPSRGGFAPWLAVIVRHVMVDWVRSRAGRRRLFACVKQLSRDDQRVFELHYWSGQPPSAIAERLASERGTAVALGDVFAALERIEQVLTDRHRAELMSWTARSAAVASLDDAEDESAKIDYPAADLDPEGQLRVKRFDESLAAALSQLPAEDAAIVRLKYIQQLSNRDIERALHAGPVTQERIDGILRALRRALGPHVDLAAGRIWSFGDAR